MVIKKSDLPAYKAQGFSVDHFVNTRIGYHCYRVLGKDGEIIATTRYVEMRRA